MAEKRTINLDVNTNTKDVQEQFNSLRKGIKETTEAIEGLDKSSKTYEKDLRNLTTELTQLEQVQKDLKKTNTDLGASFEDIEGEILPLTGRMGEMEDRLYELGLAGKQNTKEFKDLLKEVGKYRKVQIETDLAVDQSAGTMSQKLGGALQGAASGFAAVQGAMGLFGTESEEVEQALLKVNSAMALADGIRGVQEFSKSFGLASKATKGFTLAQKALNLVLAGNPLAILVTIVVSLIGYFATFTNAIDVVIDSLKSVSDWLGITDLEAEENASKREQEAETQKKLQEAEQARQERLHNSKINDLDNEIALARAQGKDTTQLQKKKIQEILKIKKAKLAELAVDEAVLENQRQILIAMSARSGLAGQLATGVLKELDKRQAEADKLKQEISKLETDLKIVDIEFEKRSKERKSSTTSSTDKTEEEERQKKIAKELADEKERLANLKKLRDEFETSLEAETDIANQRLISEQEFEIQAVQDKYFNLIEQAKQYGLDTQVLEENQRLAIKEINDRFDQEAADKQKEIDDKKKQDRDDEINAIAERYDKQFQLANDALSAIGDLVTVFAGEGEEAQKKAFKVNKAISIAQAVISTAQGITAQLAVPQDALTGANFVKAGIVAATGIAQVAKISATKFEGGSDTGGIDAPSDAGATATPTAQFNVVGDSGINQLAELQNQKPTQAFVVSSEVTTAQSLDRNRVQNATL